jgi:phosphate transport system substrate-binding protein
MITGLEQYPYSVAYVGISYLENVIQDNLGYGYLQNRAGNFVNISSTDILADVSQFAGAVPTGERISMIYGPGADSYPIVNFEYALVSKNQTSSATGNALKTFLTWCASPTGGNAEPILSYPEFIALPSNVLALTDYQINLIQS